MIFVNFRLLFNISFLILSKPGAFLFFKFLVAFSTSLIVTGVSNLEYKHLSCSRSNFSFRIFDWNDEILGGNCGLQQNESF